MSSADFTPYIRWADAAGTSWDTLVDIATGRGKFHRGWPRVFRLGRTRISIRRRPGQMYPATDVEMTERFNAPELEWKTPGGLMRYVGGIHHGNLPPMVLAMECGTRRRPRKFLFGTPVHWRSKPPSSYPLYPAPPVDPFS